MKSIIKQSGFSLFEVLGALAVSSLVIAAGVKLADSSQNDIQDSKASAYQKVLSEAAIKHIQTNFTKIIRETGPTTPKKFTISELKAAGVYSGDVLNSYGQTGCVIAVEPTDGELRVLVLTEGGNEIPMGRLNGVSKQTGSTGGFISQNALTIAQGTFGGWTEDLAKYTSLNCSGTAAGGGHLANLIILDNGSLTEGYLYRNSIPGHPELNTMKTPLVIGAIKTTTDTCTTPEVGSMAKDVNGNILICNSTTLTYKRSEINDGYTGDGSNPFWGAPVANFASLPACEASILNQVRAIKANSLGHPYAMMCNGTNWLPVGVDQNGLLEVPEQLETYSRVIMKTQRTIGEACNVVDLGLVALEPTRSTIVACQLNFGTSSYSYQLIGNTNVLPPVATFADLSTQPYAKTIGSMIVVNDTRNLYVWNGTSWIELNQGMRFRHDPAVGIYRPHDSNKFTIEYSVSATSTDASPTVQANCPPNIRVIYGICTGDTPDYGILNTFQNNNNYDLSNSAGTNGWKCSKKALAVGTPVVKSTVYCSSGVF